MRGRGEREREREMLHVFYSCFCHHGANRHMCISLDSWYLPISAICLSSMDSVVPSDQNCPHNIDIVQSSIHCSNACLYHLHVVAMGDTHVHMLYYNTVQQLSVVVPPSHLGPLSTNQFASDLAPAQVAYNNIVVWFTLFLCTCMSQPVACIVCSDTDRLAVALLHLAHPGCFV